MNNPFRWQGKPSELAKSLKPHPGNKPGRSIILAGSRPPRGGTYSQAKSRRNGLDDGSAEVRGTKVQAVT